MNLFPSKKRDDQRNIKAELLKSLTNIKKETDLLEKSFQKLSISIEELKEKQTQDSFELHNELMILDKKLDSFEKRLSIMIYEFKRHATTLNYVVKKEELETLKRKINMWSPENLVAKKEFARMLEDAKES